MEIFIKKHVSCTKYSIKYIQMILGWYGQSQMDQFSALKVQRGYHKPNPGQLDWHQTRQELQDRGWPSEAEKVSKDTEESVSGSYQTTIILERCLRWPWLRPYARSRGQQR